MIQAKYIETISVIDPDSGSLVPMCVFKEKSGGMFAVDESYIEQCLEDEEDTIPSPFDNGRVILTNI